MTLRSNLEYLKNVPPQIANSSLLSLQSANPSQTLISGMHVLLPHGKECFGHGDTFQYIN